MNCDKCKKEIIATKTSTGYGTNHLTGEKLCYECCAEQDKQFMKDNGEMTLYLSIEGTQAKVTNWPGTLSIPCTSYKIGRHNIAGKRYDVWFVFDDYFWHGVQYGDNTQICHCKKTKQAV